MVEVLGAVLSLHKLMVKLGQMIVNRLDEAGRVFRFVSARGRGRCAACESGMRRQMGAGPWTIDHRLWTEGGGQRAGIKVLDKATMRRKRKELAAPRKVEVGWDSAGGYHGEPI